MIEFLPADVSTVTATVLIISSFFTSAIMGATGIGGGVLLLSLMAALLPVAVLIPVHGVVQLGSNAGRVFLLRNGVQWPALLPFLVGSLIGALVGGKLVVALNEAALLISLAVFILYMVWGPKPKIRHSATRMLLVAGGAFSTFLTMFFGATGPFVSSLFANMFDDRRKFIATHSAGMVLQHVFKIIVFAVLGFAFAPWIWLIAAMVTTGFAGTYTGTKLLDAIPEALFRKLYRILISGIALHLLWQGLFSLTAG